MALMHITNVHWSVQRIYRIRMSALKTSRSKSTYSECSLMYDMDKNMCTCATRLTYMLRNVCMAYMYVHVQFRTYFWVLALEGTNMHIDSFQQKVGSTFVPMCSQQCTYPDISLSLSLSLSLPLPPSTLSQTHMYSLSLSLSLSLSATPCLVLEEF